MKKATQVLTCVILLMLAISCKTHKQNTIEYVYIHDTDTVAQVKLRFDSVVITDSVVIFSKGDTIFKERYHTEFRDRLRVDTMKVNITKKLYYTQEKEVIKEVNRLFWWQKALMWIGVAGMVLTLGWIFFKKFFRFV